MLEAIRKRSASIVVKALLGLLIISFAAWGVGDMIRSGSQVTQVAEVGDVEITPQALDVAVRREMANLQRALGSQFDPDRIQPGNIAGMVLRRQIDQTLYLQGARDLGMTVTDAQVSQEIKQTEAFFNELGRFDRMVFQQAIRSQGWSEEQFVARMRADMARSQYLQSLVAGAAAPAPLAAPLYRHRHERRVATVITVPDSAMPEPAAPDETTLAAFHESHSDRYTAPEYRRLTVVEIMAEDLADSVSVTEDEVREAYEMRLDEFRQPERRHLRQMIFSDEETARQARNRLDQGEAFQAVAADLAGMDADATDLGVVTREELLPELAEPAFATPEGAVTPPVKSALGWHLLKVAEVQAGQQQEFEAVRDQVAGDLKREKAVDVVFELSNQLEDKLGGGATLEEAARDLDLPLRRIDAVDRQGRTPAGEETADLPPGGNFLETAFTTERGMQSMLTEAGRDGYFILRVDEVTPPAVRPLADIRDQVVADWKAQKRSEAAHQAAENLAERLRGGAEPETVAETAGYPVTTTDPFTRSGDSAPDDMPGALVRQVFELKPGGVALAQAAEGYRVAALERVEAADPDADRKAMQALRQQLAGSLRNDLATQLGNGLRQRYPVSVNNRALAKLYQQQ